VKTSAPDTHGTRDLFYDLGKITDIGHHFFGLQQVIEQVDIGIHEDIEGRLESQHIEGRHAKTGLIFSRCVQAPQATGENTQKSL
jgi:hypothetical protein